MLNKSQELALSKATVVRPTSLQSFGHRMSPTKSLELDSSAHTDGLHSSFVGDRFQNQFQSTRSIFETWQPRQRSPQSPKSPINTNTSPPIPSSPVVDRLEAFSLLKKRFENDENNNVQQVAPRATRHSSCKVATPRESWANSSDVDNSRRSDASCTEVNDRQRRVSEMSIIREKVLTAKQELGEANERREVAERAYAEVKRRILSSKKKSVSLRDQIRSLEDIIERKQKKIDDMTKRLGSRAIVIEENRRAAEHYGKDIRSETELVRKVTEEIEATRAKRRATVERIREIVQRISPIKAAVEEAEKKEDNAKKRGRRFEDLLTKSSIRLKNARTLSADTSKRTSFKGFRIEDVQKKIGQQRDRVNRARSDISYLEYRRELLREELREWKEDVRKILVHLNPHRQQRALGFNYTRLPMSEEL